MPLRTADRSATKRFEDKDGAWIVLRINLDKGISDRIAELTQNRFSADAGLLVGESGKVEFQSHLAEVNAALFDHLVQSWSMDDEPSVAAYQSLDVESGAWVDECIAEVLTERAKRAEGNGRSPRKPRAPRSSGVKEPASN